MVKCTRVKPGLRVRPVLYSKFVREMLSIIWADNHTKHTKRLYRAFESILNFGRIVKLPDHNTRPRKTICIPITLPIALLSRRNVSLDLIEIIGLSSDLIMDLPDHSIKSQKNTSTKTTLLSELKLVCLSACGKLASTFAEINIMSDILQPLINIRGSRDDPNIIKFSHKEELLLLALYHKELYGLQIQQAISDSSNGLRQFRIGSLYPMLHSLETKGYVHSRWGDEQHHERGGARRRYYQLTETGSAAVEFIQAFHQNLINWGSGKA